MKKYFYMIICVFVIASAAYANMNWILLSSTNGKILHIADYFDNDLKTSKVSTTKIGEEVSIYILKISQNNKSYTCGVSSFCPLDRKEGTVSVYGVKESDSYGFDTDKNAEYKKPEGTIKIAHEYVCKKYYDSLIKYDTYVETAKKYENDNDFENAINSYKLAYQEAEILIKQGYSANRQAETLFLMAELSEKNGKSALARRFYQEIADLKDLKEGTSYKDRAIAKVNSIPKTKSEKAKDVGGNVLYGVGAVGLGALKLLLSY